MWIIPGCAFAFLWLGLMVWLLRRDARQCEADRLAQEAAIELRREAFVQAVAGSYAERG